MQKKGKIVLCPSDMFPSHSFNPGLTVFAEDCPTLEAFKAKVTEFRYYNCCYSRCGVAFYI
jgi:hypothetical protein